MKNVILVIEGKKSESELLSRILELANYQVIAEKHGVAGLDAIKQFPVDLVLCNVKLQELDGFGIKSALHNIPVLNAIPFIFMADRYDRKIFRRGMDLGANDFLARPFAADELLNAVEAQLKRNEMLRSAFSDASSSVANPGKKKSLQDLDQVLAQKIVKKIKKREIIYREDDMPHYLYYVVSGKIKAFKTNDTGKDYIIDIFREGDFFGYDCLLENKKYHESTMTIEDSELALVPKYEFYHQLCANGELSLKFIKYISDNLSVAEEKLLKLAYNSARKRVAEALLFIHTKYQTREKKNMTFAINREDISAISGLTVESVSRNLSSFRQEGLIESTNGTIRLLNLQRLQNLKN